MKKEMLHAIGYVCAAVLLAAGGRAQETTVRLPDNAVATTQGQGAGRYQMAVRSSEQSFAVYVIDTETGAVLSKGSHPSGWKIESEGFVDTLADVKKRIEKERAQVEVREKWVAATKGAFPSLPLDEKIKAATNIVVATYRKVSVYRGPLPPSIPPNHKLNWFVTEDLKRSSRGRLGGKSLPPVDERLYFGRSEFDNGAKEGDLLVVFEMRGEGTQLFFGIPATSLTSDPDDRDTMMLLDPSPTIVEDIKAILQKKEEREAVH